MLACAGPSRPHTCVSGSPGRGGWGGQRSPLWATATGPGLFRSLGFKNPSGYWLFGGQHTAIQRVGRLGGAEAPACVVCVFACAVVPCAKFQHFSEGGRSSGSAPGVCREGGGSSPGIGGLPPIPSNTGRDLLSTCSSTGGGAHCCRCVWFLRAFPRGGLGGGGGYWLPVDTSTGRFPQFVSVVYSEHATASCVWCVLCAVVRPTECSFLPCHVP